MQTHQRDETGRYVAPLPFKSNCIGLSKGMALRRLQKVERRLLKDSEHRAKYEDFMEEYLHLGHMEKIPLEERCETAGSINYLPHHYVLKG
jgi:hypothetical protein